MFRHDRLRRAAATMAILAALLPGCGDGRSSEQGGGGGGEERYTTPVVQAREAGINLEAVQQAFVASKGADFASWMGAFERRVNEIYEGEGVVAIDAKRAGDRLFVQGFVDQDGQAGMQGGDRALFSLEQTGPATRDAVPMRVADGQGQVWQDGSMSLLGSPFLQMFLMAGMFSWVGSYFTPRPQLLMLADHRRDYRATPAYTRQVQANRQHQQVRARRGWGQPAGTQQRPASQPRRTWGQPRNNDPWAGRRTGRTGSTPRRTWGGRRR